MHGVFWHKLMMYGILYMSILYEKKQKVLHKCLSHFYVHTMQHCLSRLYNIWQAMAKTCKPGHLALCIMKNQAWKKH